MQVNSGIEAVGPVQWGTHFCQFYETADDLADTLVPFFKAGLDNNERCMWVTARPLRAADAVDDEEGGGVLAVALDGLGDLLPFLFTAGVVLFLYRVLPSPRPRVRQIWPGAVVAAALVSLARGGLEIYFEDFADLGALYGSLGALMALLLFVYAVSLVLVFGAEYASEWSRLPDDPEEVRAELRRLRPRRGSR